MGSPSILQPHRLFLCLFAALIANTAFAQTLATTVPLVLPSAIAYDSQGNLYLSETSNHVIRRVDTGGHITTVAGTGTQGFDGDGGQASAALLDSPQGLAVNSASLYIADTHNHRIRKVDLSSGVITTVAGSSNPGSTGDNSPAASATLDTPTALTLDNQGNLYLADIGSHRIRKIAAATGIITTIAGTGTQGFEGVGSAATAALIDSPGGLAVHSNGNLYLADTHNQRVRRIDAVTGAITTVAGIGAQGFSGDSNAARTAQLSLPQGLSIDAQGNIYVADTANHRIRRIDGSTGKITTIAGDGTQAFSGDGATPQQLASTARARHPSLPLQRSPLPTRATSAFARSPPMYRCKPSPALVQSLLESSPCPGPPSFLMAEANSSQPLAVRPTLSELSRSLTATPAHRAQQRISHSQQTPQSSTPRRSPQVNMRLLPPTWATLRTPPPRLRRLPSQ